MGEGVPPAHHHTHSIFTGGHHSRQSSGFLHFKSFAVDKVLESVPGLHHAESADVQQKSYDEGEVTAGLDEWLHGHPQSVGIPGMSRRRRWINRVMAKQQAQVFMAAVVIFNVAIMVMEVDARASNRAIPLWVDISNKVLLVIYVVEVTLRIYGLRGKFFRTIEGVFDLAVVGADLCIEALDLAFDIDNFGIFVSGFRVLRLGRVLRVVRIFRAFKELTMLIHGMTSAFRAIVWAAVMIFMMLLVFSLIAVEFVHPVVQQMQALNLFPDCERCGRAFESVWEAVLTFMQTIIAGDSWGQLALPVIEYSFYTSLLFLSVLFTVQLGLLNLILAVIVDRAAQARHEDMAVVMSEKVEQFKVSKGYLLSLFKRIDIDGDGFLTEQEVVEGFSKDAGFANLFRSMGITQQDMAVVFQILNVDETGLLSYKDFVEQLHKIKTEDSHTYLLFTLHSLRVNMKKQIARAMQEVDDKLKEQQDLLSRIDQRLKFDFKPGSSGGGGEEVDCTSSTSTSMMVVGSVGEIKSDRSVLREAPEDILEPVAEASYPSSPADGSATRAPASPLLPFCSCMEQGRPERGEELISAAPFSSPRSDSGSSPAAMLLVLENVDQEIQVELIKLREQVTQEVLQASREMAAGMASHRLRWRGSNTDSVSAVPERQRLRKQRPKGELREGPRRPAEGVQPVDAKGVAPAPDAPVSTSESREELITV